MDTLGVYSGLDWELEDLLPKDLIESFMIENPDALIRSMRVEDKMHHEWSLNGKAKLHRFVKTHAIHEDLLEVINVLKALSNYFGIGTFSEE